MRKSEGESKPDAHFNVPPNALPDTKLIHTAHPTPYPLSNIPPDNLPAPLPTPLPIEFQNKYQWQYEIQLEED